MFCGCHVLLADHVICSMLVVLVLVPRCVWHVVDDDLALSSLSQRKSLAGLYLHGLHAGLCLLQRGPVTQGSLQSLLGSNAKIRHFDDFTKGPGAFPNLGRFHALIAVRQTFHWVSKPGKVHN